MKSNILSICILFSAVFSSCVKDEGPNLEADIISFKFEEIDVDPFFNEQNSSIDFELKDVDVRKLTPTITLSQGATIEPASGIYQDFTNIVTYTVTSENKVWKRSYNVIVKNIVPPDPINNTDTIRYNFEEWYLNTIGTPPKEYEYPTLTDGLWSSANSGIAIAKVGNVDEYPTRFTNDAYGGNYAALLQTQKGGKYWGNLIPIFSGSLFRGEFKLNMTNFVKSAKFGQLHSEEKGKPIKFRGYYKYKPGDVFYDENDKVIPGRIDELSIYAVVYEVTKGNGSKEFLDGTNVMTSDKAIAKADLSDRSAKGEYTEFSIPFVYVRDFDYENFDYKLAVVFASSREGDYYRGAVGSTLIVDEIEIVTELPEKKDK